MTFSNKEFQVPEKLGYVPSLDGLRAVAVSLVMLSHANFQFCTNAGEIGVDIFFAISGFLITTLLLEEQFINKKISLINFYLRRSFRLFPALYLMLLIVFLYALIFAISADKQIIFREVLASTLYLYNVSWWIWGKNELIIYHMWSLAVEEQFYLIWPLVLMLSIRYFSAKKLQRGLFIFITTFFLIKSIYGPSILNSLIYESVFIGCLFSLLRWTGTFTIRIPNSITIFCIILLLIVAVLPIPHYYEIMVNYNLRFIIGIITMIIILGLINKTNSSVLETMLSSPILVFIGRISYALYLWHLPVFKWFSWHSTLPPIVAFVLKFIVSFGLAVISWYFIEKKTIEYGKRFKKIQ